MPFSEIEASADAFTGTPPVFEVGQRVTIKCEDKSVEYVVEEVLGDPLNPSGYRFLLPR